MSPAERFADRAPDLDPVLTGEEAETLRIVLVPSDRDLSRIERYRTRHLIVDETDAWPAWQREWGGLC